MSEADNLRLTLTRLRTRIVELEAELDEALNMLVVEGYDARFIVGVGWTFGKTGALTIPVGAKDRLREMLSSKEGRE